MHSLIKKIITVFLLMHLSIVGATDFKVAVRAHNGIEKAVMQWQPTLDYLNKKIPEHRFTLVPIISLKEITVQAGRGIYDFVLTNPSSFVEIETLYGASALVTLVNDRSGYEVSRFGGVIFTRTDRTDILFLEDLAGKKLMAVSEKAFGGWRVAWLELLENGIEPYRKLDVVFTDSGVQSNVVFAVRDGEADAGIVRTDQLERMAKAGDIDMRYFRIINNKETTGFPFFHSTALYPEWPFSVMKHVPMNVVKRVKKALLDINRENTAAKAGKYVKWAEPLDYQPVRDLMLKLKVYNTGSGDNNR